MTGNDSSANLVSETLGEILIGTPLNIFYDSSLTYPCLNTSGNCTPYGTGIDTAIQTDYFFNKNNLPLSLWDFDTVWQENPGQHPTLLNTKPRWPQPQW